MILCRQYRFYVPHDPDGLADLYTKAGLDLCDVIVEAMTMESKVDAASSAYNGGSGELIHEMREMISRCWGQYECNNQNSFHVLWMLAAVHGGKCASRAQPFFHKVLTEAFIPGVRMFPGDEDNGSMSAFYLLSALGIYHLAPGSREWQITGSPLFNHVKLRVANGNVLHIRKLNAQEGICVARRLWNGDVVTGATLDFRQLAAGGQLLFVMEKCSESVLKPVHDIDRRKNERNKDTTVRAVSWLKKRNTHSSNRDTQNEQKLDKSMHKSKTKELTMKKRNLSYEKRVRRGTKVTSSVS